MKKVTTRPRPKLQLKAASIKIIDRTTAKAAAGGGSGVKMPHIPTYIFCGGP